ncbi:DUF5348 domain-containing protein [Paenibacillus sp. IB182496]|uniref:DUF5348 domain-containing protein n=1 Tax=Paenibacillus sabuli TaxID=2772509 RepID=A0A927GQW4_9BACL|nr:DUF5348 domain-containing protein [Paenibacillus sabuli]MBD2844964.1 DUF5348 domain-containing protein [Paenibacillus sabuli]
MTNPYREGWLLFNSASERWEIREAYDHPQSVHCGESFDLQIGTVFLTCRVEMDAEWYVIVQNTSFYLHPGFRYRIRVR